MERKTPFIVDELYHVYTRGVEKRVVCADNNDYRRLQLLLFLCNSSNAVRIRDLLDKYQGESLEKIYSEYDRGDTLVEILAYALMPNHLHLLVREKAQGGVSRFMLKLMTAYSMYFNIKNDRSGPLFTRPFRSQHINSDMYLRWIFAYIHTNPLDLHQNGWKQSGLKRPDAACAFIQQYEYGSFPDYFTSNRPASNILDMSTMYKFGDLKTMDALLSDLALPQGEPLGNWD